jgi:CheY-like chemotaxis protein
MALRLLIVEDDVASLELMEEVFVSLNAEVRAVGESSKAADLVNHERFDGIFLDLEMPYMNGFDLAKWIRKSSRNRSTPIITVTGRDDRQTMQQVFASGATFYLQKPVDRQKLSNLYRTVRGSLFECRRRFVRVPMQTEVTCSVDSQQLKGKSWNLSQGGMQIEVEGLKIGQTVRMTFRLPPSGATIDATGSVIWVGENRQGVHFSHVKGEQAVRDFIAAIEGPDSGARP